VTEAQLHTIYEREGKKLFRYFKDYSPDPPATAHQIKGKTYLEVGQDLFVRRTLQKERMNAGWRYQYLTIYCARETKRFESISDLGLAEADFSAKIERTDKPGEYVNLYVSVKNRKNTIGGQDFPKAVQALENIASTDKNRIGPYCCIFGITIDRGTRQIRSNKQGKPHSQNTEVWLSDFFWPFFTNCTYEEIMLAVHDALESQREDDPLPTEVSAPRQLLEAFGKSCLTVGLINELGVFDDSYKLVRFFCGS
ncbi:MAG: hypothetical protein SF029_20385, partial [bacterium]|nr:hypothetical protein [bacterium]